MWEAGYSATDTGFCREIISIKREVEIFINIVYLDII